MGRAVVGGTRVGRRLEPRRQWLGSRDGWEAAMVGSSPDRGGDGRKVGACDAIGCSAACCTPQAMLKQGGTKCGLHAGRTQQANGSLSAYCAHVLHTRPRTQRLCTAPRTPQFVHSLHNTSCAQRHFPFHTS
eukprot:366383-Chlamydomonas_euryale.AAC.2